jgi:hypothetical protein
MLADPRFRGPEWWREAYDLSPGKKSLFTVHGGEHSLGGTANYEARETTDESPVRVAAVQQLSTAYLRSTLYPRDTTWDEAVRALATSSELQGEIEST